MNILFFSNPSYGAFGYSIVAKNVCDGLRKAGHNVIMMGNVTTGRIIEDERGTKNLPMMFDGWGEDIMEHYIKAYSIELVVIMLDVWVSNLLYLPKLCKKLKIPLITHATVRSHPLSPFISRFIIDSNHIVLPSKFGYETANEWAEIRKKISYIPHGVDLGIYKHITGMKEKMKKRLGYDDKFVYLSVGRNNFYMKRYDLLFHAYKILLKNEPETEKNTLLHIHCYPTEPNSFNLNILLDRGGLTKYVKLSYVRPKENWNGIEVCSADDPNAMPHNPNFGIDEFEMAKMYNMADCHVMSTEGESACLPVIESQACGIPQVFPNHTTGPELIGEPKSGLLADIQMQITTPLISDVFYVNPILLAKCMHHMYEKADDRKEFSKNALENAKKYSWKKIIPQWVDLIEKVGEKPKAKVDYGGGELGV